MLTRFSPASRLHAGLAGRGADAAAERRLANAGAAPRGAMEPAATTASPARVLQRRGSLTSQLAAPAAGEARRASNVPVRAARGGAEPAGGAARSVQRRMSLVDVSARVSGNGDGSNYSSGAIEAASTTAPPARNMQRRSSSMSAAGSAHAAAAAAAAAADRGGGRRASGAAQRAGGGRRATDVEFVRVKVSGRVELPPPGMVMRA